MDEPIYCLKVIDTRGNSSQVWGPKGSLEPIFERWAAGEFIDGQMILIRGHCNTADLAMLAEAWRPEEVAALVFYLEN